MTVSKADADIEKRVVVLEEKVKLIALALKGLVALVVGLAVTYMFRG